MLKVLIVDDEPIICDLIHKLIVWDELDLVSLGSVQNGADAMEIILRQKPDIVITDIQMPGMTGLEMIERACRQNLPASFIVVSGYQEFEYAQQAVRFGVKEYLLKPVNKKDLNLILGRICREKGSQKAQQDQAARIQSELRKKNAILRGNEMRQSVLAADRAFNPELFHFSPGEFLTLVVHVSLRDKTAIETVDPTDVLENIICRAVDRLQGSCFDSEYAVNDCNAYLLMNYSPELHASYRERRDILQQLLHEVSVQYATFRITFGLSAPVHTDAEIGKTLLDASRASMSRLCEGSDYVIETCRLRLEHPDLGICTISADNRKKLLQLVETFQLADAQALVRELFARIESSGSYDIFHTFRLAVDLIFFIRSEVVALGLRDLSCPCLENGVDIPPEESIHRYLDNCDTFREITEFVCDYLAAEIRYCETARLNKVSEPIWITQEYIRTHIDRQISLEEVAAQAYVSPGYLCTLFKERTGKNFSDYIIEMRVEESKRLLRDPNYTINEVADRVGYSNARHFSKVFQKLVGVRPSDYRKIYH